MPTATAAKSTQERLSDAEIRAARLAALGNALATAAAGVVVGVWWALRTSWPRMVPVYWAAAELAAVVLADGLGLRWTAVGLATVLIVAVAGAWPARFPVRLYRLAVAVVFGLFATATLAAGPGALATHPTMTVFGPALAAAVLGWPWWHHLRYRTADAPGAENAAPQKDLTAVWAARWRDEVVEEGVCTGTRVIRAIRPRDGVIEATLRLSPGTKRRDLVKKGPDVEVALDLADGAVGWRATGRAAKLQLIIVEKSYIHDGVPWTGTTYAGGRCQLVTFTDGTPGHWTFIRRGFGTLNGLVVGSTGAGKSRALGVLIVNLLTAGWMVVVGDPQNGQSLPAWRNAAGEFHAGVDAVRALILRLYHEVMRRSEMLSAVGVEVFDEDDPRVQALGLQKMAAIIDECQMVLISTDRELIALVEDLVAIDRKTGVGIIFATQIPQMKSLGGSIRIRDALVAGNCFLMRLSNRGSSTTVVPDDFVGDPFALPKEINGQTTAGMGYLRDAAQEGMLSRVPMLDETAAATAAPRTPIQWQVPPVDAAAPIPAVATRATTSAAGTSGDSGGAVARLRSMFGGKPTPTVHITEQPTSTPEWVLACLRRGPASAQALLDRPDCPVKQPQLYAVLDRLTKNGRITKPAERGGPFTIA